MGEEISVSIFVYGQVEDAVFSEDGVNFHLIKQKNFQLAGWLLHRKYLQNYLNKFIAVDNIDVVEAPEWTGISAFMKLRCPLVLRCHGSDAYFCKLENRRQKKKNFWFEKMAIEGADRLVSVSQFTAIQTGKIFDLKKDIAVIPNAINTEYFKPSRNEEDSDTLLYFGSLIRKKGVLELSHIFNKVVAKRSTAKLLLLGKDVKDVVEQVSTLELFQKELSPAAKGRVEYIPEVGYEQIKNFLATATVVILPSFAEAFPMTWLEAMSMEKPMVTSNIGWAKEIMIEGKTGYMVDPLDYSTYSEKILCLLNDPGLRKEMGAFSRIRVIENFSEKVVVKKNIQFYKDTLN